MQISQPQLSSSVKTSLLSHSMQNNTQRPPHLQLAVARVLMSCEMCEMLTFLTAAALFHSCSSCCCRCCCCCLFRRCFSLCECTLIILQLPQKLPQKAVSCISKQSTHSPKKKKSKSKGQQLHESRLVSKPEIKSIRVISAAGK